MMIILAASKLISGQLNYILPILLLVLDRTGEVFIDIGNVKHIFIENSCVIFDAKIKYGLITLTVLSS